MPNYWVHMDTLNYQNYPHKFNYRGDKSNDLYFKIYKELNNQDKLTLINWFTSIF